MKAKLQPVIFNVVGCKKGQTMQLRNRILANQSVALKVYLAPVLVILLLVLVTVVSTLGMDKVSTNLSYIYEVSFQRSKQASEMVRSTNSLHADLYRFLAWRQNVKAPERIAAVRTELNQALLRQQKALDDFASLIAADQEQKEIFASIQAKNNDYRKAIADVLDLAELDSETAILYAVDAEVGIASLRKGIDGFFNSNEQALDRYFDDITAGAKESLLILVVLTAGALVVAAIVTTIVSRVISGPLREMTKTMRLFPDFRVVLGVR